MKERDDDVASTGTAQLSDDRSSWASDRSPGATDERHTLRELQAITREASGLVVRVTGFVTIEDHWQPPHDEYTLDVMFFSRLGAADVSCDKLDGVEAKLVSKCQWRYSAFNLLHEEIGPGLDLHLAAPKRLFFGSPEVKEERVVKLEAYLNEALRTCAARQKRPPSALLRFLSIVDYDEATSLTKRAPPTTHAVDSGAPAVSTAAAIPLPPQPTALATPAAVAADTERARRLQARLASHERYWTSADVPTSVTTSISATMHASKLDPVLAAAGDDTTAEMGGSASFSLRLPRRLWYAIFAALALVAFLIAAPSPGAVGITNDAAPSLPPRVFATDSSPAAKLSGADGRKQATATVRVDEELRMAAAAATAGEEVRAAAKAGEEVRAAAAKVAAEPKAEEPAAKLEL